MDNASKALIIAGAILISVALVSLGVYLYSIGANAANQSIAQIDVLNMQMQNSNLQKYEGSKKGSEVKQMVDYVNAVNSADAMPTDIAITGDSEITGGATTTFDATNIRNAGIYTVKAEIDATSGYVKGMVVNKK